MRFAGRALYWANDSGRDTTFVYTEEADRLLRNESPSAERLQTE